MSDTPRTIEAAGFPSHNWEKTAQRLFECSQKLERELAEARKDKERLDWLDVLKNRHEMTPCFRGKTYPDGLRKDWCGSDMHISCGGVSLYVRDSLDRIVSSGNAGDIRAAIDAAMKGQP